MEHHDVIDTVEELGAEGLSHGRVDLMAHLLLVLAGKLGDSLGAHVARHDDDRVLEGHLATLAIGQTTVVKHLQQHVEDIRVSLLHLVEQDHGVRTTAHGLGELAALVVTHVSRGRTDQTLDAELLHVLGHVDTHERALVVEQALGQRLGELGLAYAGGAQEEEAADGLVRIGEARAAAAHGRGDSGDGLVLADNALVQLALQALELVEFALHHLGHGYAGPGAYDLGNLIGGHLLVEAFAILLLLRLERGLGLLNLLLQARDHGVAQLGRTAQIAVARRALLFALGLVKLALKLLHVVNGVLLVEPAGLLHVEFFLDLGNLLAQGLQTLLGGVIGLFHERLFLDLQLSELTRGGVDLDRHAVEFHAQAACRLIDQIDGLVGQEAVGDVAIGEVGSCHERAIGDMHTVEDLVLLLEATQDRNGVLDGRLGDHHGLETTGERRVLLDVLAVFVERGRANRVQVATGERRLEDVAGVHGALGGTRAHDGVELIDEQDDLAFGLLYLLEHSLQAVLELAAVLSAGDQRAHVELDKVAVAQGTRHVAGHDTLGDALDDGRLADTRLADEHGVVLGAAGQDLNGATDLVGTANDRVELAGAGKVADIAAVLFQRLKLGLVLGGRHAVIATQLLVDLLDTLLGDAGVAQHAARLALVLGKRHQQMLGHHKAVAHLGGLLLGLFDDADELVGQAHLLALARNLGRVVDGILRGACELSRVGTNALYDHGDIALAGTEQGGQQVNRLYRAGLRVGSRAHGGLQRLARRHC